MAITTNIEISPSDGWVEVANNFSSISLKANSGNWKSWRLFITEDSPPDNDDEKSGHLLTGNSMFETNQFTGSIYVRVMDDYDPIDFSIIFEPFSL